MKFKIYEKYCKLFYDINLGNYFYFSVMFYLIYECFLRYKMEKSVYILFNLGKKINFDFFLKLNFSN